MVKKRGQGQMFIISNPIPIVGSLMKQFCFLKIVKTGVPELSSGLLKDIKIIKEFCDSVL